MAIPTISLSTTAFPKTPLEGVAEATHRLGFDGVELRSFHRSRDQFACDPLLTDAKKVRRVLSESSVRAVSVGTSVSFDAAVQPPIIGNVLADRYEAVPVVKRMVHLAASIECPFVRVFGFRAPSGEKLENAKRRIAERLKLAATTARHTGVTLVVENGGSFNTAEDMVDLLDRVDSSLLKVCYSTEAARLAGLDPFKEIESMRSAVALMRIGDATEEGVACAPGEGVSGVLDGLGSIAKRVSGVPVVVDYPVAWMEGLTPPGEALEGVAERIARCYTSNAGAAQPA